MSPAKPLGLVVFCGTDIIVPQGAEIGLARSAGTAPDPAGNSFPLVSLVCGSLPVHPDIAARSKGMFPDEVYHAAFHFENEHYLSVLLNEGQLAVSAGFSRLSVRQLIGMVPPGAASFILKAQAYANWSVISRYCGSCASPLADGEGQNLEGAKVCPACGHAFFPRISPAVIVLIHRGKSMLLAHNVKFPAGRYGLIAGFVEMGETLEETVHREIMEESGIEVGQPHYVKSQPWPFPDSLMIAFEAEYKSGEIRPDGVEIESLGWFEPGALPDLPPPGSVARFLIDRFTALQRERP